MHLKKTVTLTTWMIYVGTILLSVLSFFTTLFGMLIMVSWPLAIIGSLGIQIAILGIAWNLIRIHEGRWKYVTVFIIASSFSVFFSYANFDMNIKSNVRPLDIRNAYYESARSTLGEYSALTKKTALTARFQMDRINDLIRLEEQKGWATISDEGSQDKFVQSIIDGARRAVESWKMNQGSDYRQGKGRGLIVNYLETRRAQSRGYYSSLENYLVLTASLSTKLSNKISVQEQFDIVNKAYIEFPSGEMALINSENDAAALSKPPSMAAFVETPDNRQQSLMLVINDLYKMDSLSLVALLLAFSVDFIVMLMALAGGYAIQNMDYLMERLEDDAETRIKKTSLDDNNAFSATLEGNILRYRKGAQYSLDIMQLVSEYKTAREGLKAALRKKSAQLRKTPPSIVPLEATKQTGQKKTTDEPAIGNIAARQKIVSVRPIKKVDIISPIKSLLKMLGNATALLAGKTSQLLKQIITQPSPKARKSTQRTISKKKPPFAKTYIASGTRLKTNSRFRIRNGAPESSYNPFSRQGITDLVGTIKSKKVSR